MAKLIGTAGHVDHGKTTLIRALTGIDADRLPEEKQRGMTIDVGFAYIELPGIGRVSIVDVPGHEKFIRNMLVGVQAVDVVLLCVAADEGVKPQTREHFQILQLLPVERMVVALTRSDIADKDTRELAQLDVEDLLSGTRFAPAPRVEVSAQTGEGLEELKQILAEALGGQSERPGTWYLPIDRVFGVKGHGCIVTGTLARGNVKIGDQGYIEPGHVDVRVRAIHSHEELLQESEHGKRTALNLSGVKVEDVRRGQAVGEPGALFETSLFDAKMTWSIPPKHGMRVRVSIGSEEVMGKVFLNDKIEEIAQFRLESEIACALGQPLIVRRYSPPEVLGGGSVVVPLAIKRRKSEAVSLIESGSDEVSILTVLANAQAGLKTEEICRQLGKTAQSLGDTFEKLSKSGVIRGFAGLWLSGEQFDSAQELLLAELALAHKAMPMAAFVPREKVVHAAGFKWAGKPLDRIFGFMAEEGKIAVQGTGVRLADFKIDLSPKQRAFLDRVIAEFAKSGINVPTPHELARLLTVPPQAVDEILKLGVQSGELVRVADFVFFGFEQLEDVKRALKDLFGTGPFTAADFRDRMGTSRKYAIPLLEYFDTIRFTLRQGDQRVVQ